MAAVYFEVPEVVRRSVVTCNNRLTINSRRRQRIL